MNNQQRSDALNMSFEAMLAAQNLIQQSETPRQKLVSQILYNLSWCVWNLIIDNAKHK